MATTTPNLGLTKPTVGADADAWGGQLNASLDTLDAKVLDKTTGGTVNGPISVTNLSYSGSLTGGTGVINIGSGQVFKDAAGNLGLGVTPSAWGTNFRAQNFGSTGVLYARNGGVELSGIGSNAYSNNINFLYIQSSPASLYQQTAGVHQWFTAPSGTAGAPITFTQAMTLTSGGNLLVGTTVDGLFRLRIDGSNNNEFARFNGATSNIDIREFGNNQVGFATGADDNLILGAGAAERARITSGGNLLVGTTDNTGHRLVVVSPASVSQLAARFNGTDGTNSAVFDIAGSGINPVLEAVGARDMLLRTNNTERARITSAGFAKFSNTGSYPIEAITGNNSAGLQHQFNSNQNTETIIVNNGNTGSSVRNIHSFLASGSTGFHYQGTLNGSLVYSVLANGNVQNTNNSYGAISDIKLKENVTDATPKLASLNKLRVVNYNLIGSELKQIGLIAQEVEQVFPGLVESTPDLDPETKEPTGTVTKSVKYSVLVPMLLKAVQELSAKVAALEAK